MTQNKKTGSQKSFEKEVGNLLVPGIALLFPEEAMEQKIIPDQAGLAGRMMPVMGHGNFFRQATVSAIEKT